MMNVNTPQMWDGAWAEHHARYAQHAGRRQLASSVISMLPEGAHVLDIGGGCGAFPQLYERVTVLDFSSWAVAHLQDQGIAAQVWDARDPTPVDGCYDAVVCMDLLEHLDAPEKVVAFARSVAPLGYFAVPNNCMGPESCRQHQRTYTKSTLECLLSASWTNIEIQVVSIWLLAAAR